MRPFARTLRRVDMGAYEVLLARGTVFQMW